MRVCGITLALLVCSGASHAATVFKCVDAQGKITFTANANCPQNAELSDVVSAYNPTISRDGEHNRMAESPRSRSAATQQAQPNDQPRPASASSGGCTTGLSDQDLRTAKVRGEVVPGMSRDEIKSMMGNPTDKSARGGGGSTYWSDRYRQVFDVSFDRKGCVRSTQAAGYKP